MPIEKKRPLALGLHLVPPCPGIVRVRSVGHPQDADALDVRHAGVFDGRQQPRLLGTPAVMPVPIFSPRVGTQDRLGHIARHCFPDPAGWIHIVPDDRDRLRRTPGGILFGGFPVRGIDRPLTPWQCSSTRSAAQKAPFLEVEPAGNAGTVDCAVLTLLFPGATICAPGRRPGMDADRAARRGHGNAAEHPQAAHRATP